MDEKKLLELSELLIDFSNLPCDTIMQCEEFCPIYDYCSMLFSLSKGMSGELTVDEVLEKIEADYKNTKWEENN